MNPGTGTYITTQGGGHVWEFGNTCQILYNAAGSVVGLGCLVSDEGSNGLWINGVAFKNETTNTYTVDLKFDQVDSTGAFVRVGQEGDNVQVTKGAWAAVGVAQTQFYNQYLRGVLVVQFRHPWPVHRGSSPAQLFVLLVAIVAAGIIVVSDVADLPVWLVGLSAGVFLAGLGFFFAIGTRTRTSGESVLRATGRALWLTIRLVLDLL